MQTVLSLHFSLTLPKFNIKPWKMMLGRLLSWVTFQGRAVKLREGNPKCSRTTITLPPGSGSTKSSCRGVALKTSWAPRSHTFFTKTKTQRRINWTYTGIINHAYIYIHNYMHNILYIVYIYSYINITYNYVYLYIYILWLTLRSFSFKKTGVRSSALEPLPHWQFAPMISSPGRTLWGKPYDTVCMISSVLLRLPGLLKAANALSHRCEPKLRCFGFCPKDMEIYEIIDWTYKLQGVSRYIIIRYHHIWNVAKQREGWRDHQILGRSPRQSLKETFTLLARQRLFDALHEFLKLPWFIKTMAFLKSSCCIHTKFSGLFFWGGEW